MPRGRPSGKKVAVKRGTKKTAGTQRRNIGIAVAAAAEKKRKARAAEKQKEDEESRTKNSSLVSLFTP